MTDEEIVKALAEKVMGWSRDGTSLWVTDHPGFRPRAEGYSPPAWNPLTWDQDACAVLDKMVDRTGFVMIDFAREDRWLVTFREDVRTWEADGRDTNRRRAICLAALKAIGVNTE